jgi:hypothetical protein
LARFLAVIVWLGVDDRPPGPVALEGLDMMVEC